LVLVLEKLELFLGCEKVDGRQKSPPAAKMRPLTSGAAEIKQLTSGAAEMKQLSQEEG
jgi:hypothetical protein